MRTLVLVLLLTFSVRGYAITYYFSNSGSDGAAGTSQATAWSSLAKLNTVIGSLSPGDSLKFQRGGTWTGSINAPSNGSSGNRIVFTYYGTTGAAPIINGWAILNSWTNLGSNIWEAAANSGSYLNLVTLNNVPLLKGRTPNAGSYYRVSTSGGISFPDVTGFLTSPSLNAATKNWTGARAVVRSTEYTRDPNFVTSHTDSTLSYNSESAHNADIGAGFFFQDESSVLDQQNEWYYNPVAHTIRMYSTANPSTLGTIKAAVYDGFVNKDPISWVEFNGINFEGFDSICMRFRTGTGMKVINNSFNLIGCDAIFTDTDTKDTIQYNVITNILNTGIHLSYGTFALTDSNNVSNCGLWEGLAQGNNQSSDGILLVNMYDSCKVTNNTVINVGYCGITTDGRNFIVRKNYVNGFGHQLADGGGIYTCCYLDSAGGIFIGMRYIDSNVVANGHGLHKGSPVSAVDTSGMIGIYIDDNAGKLRVLNNSVSNVTRSDIFLHNAPGIWVHNNTMFAGRGEFAFSTADDGAGVAVVGIDVSRNTMYGLPGVPLIQLSSVLNDYGSQGKFSSNNYARSSGTNVFNTLGPSGGNYTFATWKSTFGYDAGTIFTTVNDDSVRYEFNGAPVSKYALFSNTYSDVNQIGYYQYVPIQKYSSLFLFRKTFSSITTGRPIKFIQ